MTLSRKKVRTRAFETRVNVLYQGTGLSARYAGVDSIEVKS